MVAQRASPTLACPQLLRSCGVLPIIPSLREEPSDGLHLSCFNPTRKRWVGLHPMSTRLAALSSRSIFYSFHDQRTNTNPPGRFFPERSRIFTWTPILKYWGWSSGG